MCAQAGITYRQLIHWLDRGVIHAERDHPGSGQPHTFHASEAYVARVVGELAALGCSLDVCADVARQLRPGAGGVFDGVVYVDKAGRLTRTVGPTASYVLDLDELHRELVAVGG